ncbi:hypothetical protein [Rhizobium sp. BK251]|uniref:hypothetical protein n=1 Tax=Rhizobium sp. BK251 TaxID=2512125 RepID=UPI00104E66EF|nr:hypothetical protein [Rhizobium sp. BK251]
MQPLELAEIRERVALAAPYFAFSDMEMHGDGSIRAHFDAEHQTGFEQGPIAMAEMVRHLATLGACAAVAGQAMPKTYYLGTKGRLKVLRPATSKTARGTFDAFSEVLARDKRSLTAHSTVSNGDFLAYFHCEYQVIPETIFSRTFKHYRCEDVIEPVGNPYAEPIELEFDAPEGMSLTAHSRPLPSGRFSGHFHEYPSWPASIYAEAASRAAGRLLHHLAGEDVKYSPVRMDIDALRLISASDSLSFHVRCLSASRPLSHYVFSVSIQNGDTVASVIEMEAYV